MDTHFDPARSKLERNPGLLDALVRRLAPALGAGAAICGILEIGSFAKAEAVPGSDSDLRIYVSSPDCWLVQKRMSRFSEARQAEEEADFAAFEQAHGKRMRRSLDWYEFNAPLAAKLSDETGVNIEFGIVDRRYAEFMWSRLDTVVSVEHALLLQSNILYDPRNFLRRGREGMRGRRFAALDRFYRARYLDDLPFEVYNLLEPDHMDAFKLEKSGQIQWVKWAVRCLRDAVATRAYLDTGEFIYRRPDVLNWYAAHLPSAFAFVEELYRWKTDPVVRERLVRDFVADPEPCFARFRAAMPELCAIVQKVRRGA